MFRNILERKVFTLKKKAICLVATLALSSVLLSGCSLFKTGSGDDAAVETTVNPQKEYNDQVLGTMQEISSYEDIIKNCSNKKVKKKYEKISYDAGALTIKFQTEQLSADEIEDGMKKMENYKKKCDKLLEKIGATPAPAA
jgi:predicted small secreted protein